MPASQPNPEYHYYRAPYPILSFIAGLYCDKHWSDEEFRKWEASEDENHRYHYKGYRFPYRNLSDIAVNLFDDVVPDQRTEKNPQPERNLHHPDKSGRRAPNRVDCVALWDDLSKELTKEAEQPRGDGRLPLFFEKKATLSTLAAIYLGDEVSVKQALSYWKREGNDAVHARFQQLSELKDKSKAGELLETIKDALFDDLVDPPNCW